MKKLKKQQLDKLRKLVGEIRELKVSLADIEISISKAETSKKIIMSDISKAERSFKEYSEELQNEIGDVNIDLTTGEYS